MNLYKATCYETTWEANCIAMRVLKTTNKQTQFSLTLSIQTIIRFTQKRRGIVAKQNPLMRKPLATKWLASEKLTRRRLPMISKLESHLCGLETAAIHALTTNEELVRILMIAHMMAIIVVNGTIWFDELIHLAVKDTSTMVNPRVARLR